MQNKAKVAATAICALVLATSAASAARVSPQGGAVLINKGGDGFAPIAADVELEPGARVLVQPGGVASIVYAGNCTVRVGQGFWMVQHGSPCTNGATEIDLTGRMNQAGPGEGLGPNQFVIGGLVLGGAIGVGVLISQAASSPSSP